MKENREIYTPGWRNTGQYTDCSLMSFSLVTRRYSLPSKNRPNKIIKKKQKSKVVELILHRPVPK